MKSLFRLAAELQVFFTQRHWKFCFIGGIVLLRQENQLDWPYILKELTPLCELKEDPAIIDRLNGIRKLS